VVRIESFPRKSVGLFAALCEGLPLLALSPSECQAKIKSRPRPRPARLGGSYAVRCERAVPDRSWRPLDRPMTRRWGLIQPSGPGLLFSMRSLTNRYPRPTESERTGTGHAPAGYPLRADGIDRYRGGTGEIGHLSEPPPRATRHFLSELIFTVPLSYVVRFMRGGEACPGSHLGTPFCSGSITTTPAARRATTSSAATCGQGLAGSRCALTACG